VSLDPLQHTAHRLLVLDDVEQALTGLNASLRLDVQGLPQAGLHARDLAQSLGNAGLTSVAQWVSDLAQRLSQGEAQALFLSRAITPVIAGWVAQARQGQIEPDATVLDHIAHWKQKLSVQGSPIDQPAFDNLSAPPTRPVLPQGLQGHQVHASGLSELARIRAEIGLGQLNPQTLNVRLSAFEDWLLSLGQFALSDIYPAPQHRVTGAWADQAVFDLLRGSLDWAYRASSLAADTCQLILRLDWVGAWLEAAEAAELGRRLARLEGRAENLPEGGWRLWMPASRRRMQMQTFRQGSHHFAISAALLSRQPAPGDTSLHLQVGLTQTSLPVDAIGAQAAMNLHPIPACVPVPRRVGAVAVDPAGALFPMLKMAEAAS
jgi:hypothetical protein